MSDTELLPRIETDADGKPVRAFIPSKSQPGTTYELVPSPSGRWMHVDATCPGWVNNQHCYHVSGLEALTMELRDEETGQALVVRNADVLAKVDALDEQAVIARLSGGLAEVTKKWVYSFQSGGQRVVGLSIDGVQEAARHLATQGEAIEQVWVHLDAQNEDEAYFTACAVRYAVAADGKRVELDRAIRAKRQPKWIKKRDGGTQFNEFWYEVGVAKAVRNAVEALLPESIKQHMIKYAGQNAPAAPAANGQTRQSTPPSGDVPEPNKNLRGAVEAMRKADPEWVERLVAGAKQSGFPTTAQGNIAWSRLNDEQMDRIERLLNDRLNEDQPEEADPDDEPIADDGEQGRLA